jgi:hypothetical protein
MGNKKQSNADSMFSQPMIMFSERHPERRGQSEAGHGIQSTNGAIKAEKTFIWKRLHCPWEASASPWVLAGLPNFGHAKP